MRSEAALGDGNKSAFSSGHILQTGPFVPGGWYSLLATNRALPSLPFSSPLRKRLFAEFVLLHPPPPQICESYSHSNQSRSPTERRSVASYTVPRCSRPPDIHFLTNFLLTRVSTVSRVTSEFALNWRIIPRNPAKQQHVSERCRKVDLVLFVVFPGKTKGAVGPFAAPQLRYRRQ